MLNSKKGDSPRIQKEHADLEIKYVYVPSADPGWKNVEGIPKDLYARAAVLCTLSFLLPAPSIPLTTASGIHGPQIAEWVILTTLAPKRREWVYGGGRGVRDIVCWGTGVLDGRVARVAKAMGRDDKSFIVPGTSDPNGEIPGAWYSGLEKESSHDKETPPSSPSSPPPTPLTYVANISRGAIINQPALVSTLHANQLRGAALDLWSTPNVVITPHVSGSSVNYAKRARLRDGRKLVNKVGRKKGY
ncbi:hypothetical protein V2W45_1474428 [Cenococcum geophilum]